MDSFLYPVAALAGIATHLGYFIRGEHHMAGPKLIPFYLSLYALLCLILYQFGGIPIHQSIIMASVAAASYLTALFTSMLGYRAFFHPLREFNGPFASRLSNLYHVSHLGKLDNYKFVDRLHKQYGDIVRTGPSNLSIIIPEAVPIVLGPDSKCTKSPWYDQSLPLISMHQCREKQVHDKRRRVWSRGFSPSALRDYETRVVKYTQDLLRQISSFSGKPLNASKWFNFLSFDVMGDLAFGSSFDMLRSGERHWALELLDEGMMPIGMFTPIPWLIPVLTRIPGAAAGYKKFIAFCAEQVDRRMEMKVDSPDIMSWLLEAHEKGAKSDTGMQWLHGDSRLVIVAGSDTTAATLTHIFYHLAKDQTQIRKLREELIPLLKGNSTIDREVQSAGHLNGVINEALRLHPPVPSGLPRLTPPEGIKIRDTFIPGGTTIMLPAWPMGYSEEIYARAREFIPERWYSAPDLIKHREAFAPFNIGPYGCIGKQLALMQIRTVVTQILLEFDVSFAPGEDGTSLLEKTKDYFTLGLGDLNLTFQKRKV